MQALHATKTTFALLLGAAGLVGTAQAQSSVTLYTLLDLNVSRYSAGSRGGGDVTLLNDGHVNGLQGSRLGLRASEDLGGGLRAFVTLEGGINVDTGTQAQGGRAWGRQAFIGLAKSGVGEFRWGRQYILSDNVVGESAPFGNGLVNNASTGVSNAGRNLPLFFNAPRIDNALQLSSAPLLGTVLTAQVALGEGNVDRFHGLRVVHSHGPVYIGLAHEWSKSRSSGRDVNQSTTFSAAWDFGAVKVMGGAQRNQDLTTSSGAGAAAGVPLVVTGATTFTMAQASGWTLGAEVPFGALSLGLNFTRMAYESATGVSADLGKLALGGRYALSKRTFVYAGLSQATGDLKDYINQERVLQLGVRSAF
jgi:general bacterial porin, GBP family